MNSAGTRRRRSSLGETDVPRAKEPITPREFAEQMRGVAYHADEDPERAAGDGLKLILQVLEQCGFREGIRVYLEMKKY